jgi:hypothetical protein
MSALFLGAASSQGALINGGFETGNLSGWSISGAVEASPGVNYSVGTVLPDSGSYAALLTSAGDSAENLASIMGITEAALEASNGGINATNGTLLYQTVFANAGDAFTFRWNFVEADYLPFDDWAFYGISFNGGPATVTKFTSLGSIGPGSGETIAGWTTLSVNINTTGNYTFYFGIVNALDQSLDSFLWVDGVTAAPAVPEPASLGLLLVGAAGIFRRRRA